MKHEIKMFPRVGKFAENKDAARDIRLNEILPALENGKEVIINFQDIDSATQSFVHALISDIIRKKGIDILDHIFFKNCNEIIQKIIKIVVEYMQDVS
jgi:hypothetical protein